MPGQQRGPKCYVSQRERYNLILNANLKSDFENLKSDFENPKLYFILLIDLGGGRGSEFEI